MAAIFKRKGNITASKLPYLLELENRKMDRLEIEKLWFQYVRGKQIDLKYSAVSIYGIGVLGIELFHLLRENKIPVDFFVDKKPVDKVESVKVYRPDDALPHTDIMIVTAVYDYWDIRYKYVFKGLNVVSIMDIMNGLIV